MKRFMRTLPPEGAGRPGRPDFVGWVYGLFMAATLLICLFGVGRIPHARAYFDAVFLPMWLLLPLGLCAVLVLLALSEWLGPRIRHGRIALLVASVCLFLFQVAAVTRYYFFTDWDVEALIDLSYLLVHGGESEGLLRYFSRYPNNLFLGWVFAQVRGAAAALGLERFEYGLLLVMQCALNALTGALLVLLLRELGCGRGKLVFGYSLYVLLIGLSPWVSIPYSDSLCLPFPCLEAWLALRRGKRTAPATILRWALVGLCVWIGYRIKPQALFILPAILLRGLFSLRESAVRKAALPSLGGLAAGILAAALLCNAAVDSLQLPLKPEAAFGPTHFLMMGLNSETMGVYSREDVEFSDAIPTRQERSAANLRVAGERARTMGLGGLAGLAVQKTLTNYGDGTFCWDGEGEFYIRTPEREDSRFGQFFRDLYYSRAWEGRYFRLWANAEQLLWMAVLLLGCVGAWRAADARLDCLMLAILALSAFELLFEARARYLYIYVPLYIALAVSGLSQRRKTAPPED